MYTYRIRSARRVPRSFSAVMAHSWHSGIVLIVLAALLVCGCLAWVTMQICNSTQVIRGGATELPRNVIDMHAIYDDTNA